MTNDFPLVLRGLRWVFTAFVDKDDDEGRVSQFRVLLWMFGVAYVQHWPADMSIPAVSAMGMILFGLPVRDLMKKVPAAEALEAVKAFFDNMVGKAAAAMADRAGGYFSQTTASAWGAPATAVASVPSTAPQHLGEEDLMVPVVHGRAEPEPGEKP